MRVREILQRSMWLQTVLCLYVDTVNGRDAPNWKFWAETENSGCAWSKTKNAL